jgi:hypothetical protein
LRAEAQKGRECYMARKSQSKTRSAEVDALAETVRIGFGPYLAEEDMAEIKRGIERTLGNAEALRKVRVTNEDAPDFLFQPR